MGLFTAQYALITTFDVSTIPEFLKVLPDIKIISHLLAIYHSLNKKTSRKVI